MIFLLNNLYFYLFITRGSSKWLRDILTNTDFYTRNSFGYPCFHAATRNVQDIPFDISPSSSSAQFSLEDIYCGDTIQRFFHTFHLFPFFSTHMVNKSFPFFFTEKNVFRIRFLPEYSCFRQAQCFQNLWFYWFEIAFFAYRFYENPFSFHDYFISICLKMSILLSVYHFTLLVLKYIIWHLQI